jgi:hypothetical protein
MEQMWSFQKNRVQKDSDSTVRKAIGAEAGAKGLEGGRNRMRRVKIFSFEFN